MLRLSSFHLIRNNFPCHFLSLAISKNCFSWDCFSRFPPLAAVITFPSVVTHTGFRVSSWSVILSSSAYLAASYTSDWWPDAMACSSNSLTVCTVWSEFWCNFSRNFILVTLYSFSTDQRPLPPFSLGTYNKEVRLTGCLPPLSTMIFRTALSTSLNSDRGQCWVHIKYRSSVSAYWLVDCTRLQSDGAGPYNRYPA